MSEPINPHRDPAGDKFTREQDRVDVRALHEPIINELAEPRDGYEPIPVWLIILFFGLLGWGGWYLGNFNGGWNSEVYTEDPKVRLAAALAMAKPTPVDPLVLGKRVFTNCQACHQAAGTGIEGTYPPLAGSELVRGEPEPLIKILLHGLEGPITVKGKPFNNVMPAWGGKLSDEQIAAVLTHIRQSWGNSAGAVSPELVAKVRKETASRTAPWTYNELGAHGSAAPASQTTPATQPAPAGNSGDAKG